VNKKLVLSVLSTAVVASMASAAMAKPQPGFYVGGDVDKYYSIDAFLGDHFDDALDAIISELGDTVFVDADANAAPFVEALDANTAEELAAIMKPATVATFNGNVYTNVEDPTAEPYNPATDKDLEPGTPVGDLVVESVSAINASQIQIVFSQKVDETSAESSSNVTFDGFTPATYELQDDEKTLIVTTNAPITKKKDVVVTVKNVTLADDSSVVVPTFTKVITVEDTTPADVAKVVSKTNGEIATTVDIYFSEPVKSGVVKINGQQVSAPFGSATEKVTVTGLSLDATKTHTLEVVNLTDTADNKSTVTKSFTVTADVEAPKVAELAQYSDNAVLVTFDKKMNAATVDGNIKVADTLLNNVAIDTVVALPGDTSKTKFIVPITATLYGTKDSVTLNLAFTDGIQDSLGNKVAPTTKQITLTKDVTAPVVEKVTAKKDADGKVVSLVLEFNEPLKAGTYSSSNITVINQEGVDVTSDLLGDGSNVAFKANSETVAAGDKKVEFKLNSATKLAGEYTFTFAKGLVKDSAQTANDSAAYTKVINFGDAEAPVFEIGETDVTSAGTNKFRIDFGRAVKGGNVAGSATALENYTLNGSALPTGTTITLNSAKQVATITLPASSIERSDTAAVFTVQNVQSLSGLTIKPLTTTVAIVDNVAPVLTSAKVLDNKTIELTYSENMADLDNDNVFDSFKVVNGTTAIAFSSGELLADSVSGFDNKVKITINKVTGATPAVDGTATLDGADASIANIADETTANATGTVTVTIEDDGAGNLEVKVDGTVETTLDGSGNGSITVNGVVVDITGGADGNEFTVTTTAAVAAVPGTPVTLDLNKAITVQTLTTTVVKDEANNPHKAAVTVTVSK